VRVANGDVGDAVFSDGDVILTDNLPGGATYAVPTVVDAVNVAAVSRIDCSIGGTTLTCRSKGAAGVIVGGSGGLGAGRFDVKVQVTATVSGSLVNTCTVDPDSKVAESDETNNTCADTVTALPAFVAVTPFRLEDTRPGGVKVGSADGSAGPLRFNVLNRGGLPGSGVGAVSLNVTVVDGGLPTFGGGFATVDSCVMPRPNASNLNFGAGQTIPNSVITPVSATGEVCVYVFGTAHILVDISGYDPT
jgi:hypothetical protein